MEGLRWLGEDCPDDSGCQRFLYFSGLGHHLGSGSVANGIIPIDYRKLPGIDGSASYIDPKTVISGQDLNNCLVDSLCGKRVKLTVVLDCYFGKGYCPPDFQPELLGFTRIRGRNLFQSRLAGLREAGTRMEDLPIVGNLLNLPVKMQLGSPEPISSDTIVPSDKVNLGTVESNSGKEEFKAFSESCQICWITPESTAEVFEEGWFTSVFVESLTQPGRSGMCKYGELHGHLRTALDKLNDLHSHVRETEQTGKNEKALPGYFYLNQYASQNVVDGFEDKLVEL
ncbi:hypothetical protein FRC09_006800 [Ceratobasidium sp. 395]|nr:hypothetical protein FRC09_006800 [Ceratobasidium sp. 395]